MKRAVILLLFLVGRLISQNYSCDCLVRYGFHYTTKTQTNNALKPLTPQKGQKFSHHLAVKDSGAWFYYIPNIFDSLGLNKKVHPIKKSDSKSIMVEVLFNGKDSIPVYEETSTKSNVIAYIKQSSKEDEYSNYEWFLGCKNGFVRIMLPDKNGWITSENYKHYKKSK